MAVRALEDAVVAWIGVAGSTNIIRSAVGGIEPSVIEGCACPTGRRMAERTCRGESRSNVIGIIGCLVLRFVAAKTVGGQRGVIVVYVTIGARNLGMKARKREGSVVVIE